MGKGKYSRITSPTGWLVRIFPNYVIEGLFVEGVCDMKIILVAMFLIFSLSIFFSRTTFCLVTDEVTNGNTSNLDQLYEHEETRELVTLVKDATELVRTKGEEAFRDFRISGSRSSSPENTMRAIATLVS